MPFPRRKNLPIDTGPIVLALTLALGAFAAEAEVVPPPLLLVDAWVRAMPPGRPMTAAYLRLVNTGSKPIAVTAVSASAGQASLHESRRVDGQMQMREVAQLQVPGQGEIALAPGGLHIMVMGLDTTPAEGDTLRLCLTADDAEICTDAPVQRRAP